MNQLRYSLLHSDVDDFQNTGRIDEMLSLHFVVKNSTKKRLLRLNKIKYDAA